MSVKRFSELTRSELRRLRWVKRLAKSGPKLPRRKLAEFILSLARSKRLA